MLDLVHPQIDGFEIVEIRERVRVKLRNPVVSESYVNETFRKRIGTDAGHEVVAGLQKSEPEISEAVKVAQVHHQVVADIEPGQRVGQKCKVEPLNLVGGNVEEFEVGEMRKNTVEIVEIVFVQIQYF